MPNWAWGPVRITGTKENVLAFSKRFITQDKEEDIRVLPGVKFFGRSFYDYTRDALEDEIRSKFPESAEAEEATVEIMIDFAWSATSCLISNYPLHSPECISLADACKEDHVDVVIQTQEPGMCFEEHISCDRNGKLEQNESDMPTGKCRHCGYTESIASTEDPSEYECNECGEVGFDIISAEEVCQNGT